MSAANNLIKEFCQSIGMEGLGLDEQQQRSLCFDNETVVTFIGDKSDMITALCFISDLGDPVNMRKLLEENFLPESHGGARFSLEPGTDRVVMSRQWHAVKTDVPEFSNSLEAFVNSAIVAQKYFANGGTPAQESKKETQELAPVKDTLANAYESV